MNKAAAPTTKSTSSKNSFTVGSLGLQLLDTTWRIAVPVVVLALAGIFVDRKVGSKPWATLTGALLGFVIAGWLLKRQIAAVEREDAK